ncbi:AmmeMemoRadiSam system protein A [Neomoorella thermoacetica]|uniref:2-aminophenol 1,6-dioxygenase alpha subunit n=1 Tax=Neomoorella thermoacetica TaxID=1525 RepID=A0A1J5JM82_NEOTH|nr:AmmeMemoRadiSam system protein A [Moorella thermoacetica]OIQ09954.1 2-aminophenol 1,6-dioxygenase alpha subunit [Moorella thermoacetica]OIQ10658.1 2-aminophenol 1,6-dioxygenase alpha subunit [Moorella thermoacetica]
MGRLLDVGFMPHPPIMVPEVGRGEVARIKATVAAARELAARVAAHQPEVIIIISPHGPVFRDAVGIWATPELAGDLAAFRAGEVRFKYSLDLDLSRAIAAKAREEGIAVAWLDARASSSYGLTPELDHGMMVPLYFLRQAGLEVPLVAMGMAFMERKKLYAFGAALARAVKDSPRRALLVASGDMSHRLLPGAPAGYDPRGKVFDARIRNLLAALDVEGILAIPEDLAEGAGECGLRSFIMGLGALDGYRVKGEVLSYEGPFGVGYLVAHLEPGEEAPERSLLAPETAAAREESLPVRLARQSLEHYLRTGKVLPVPDPLPPELAGRAGVFVSLKKNGQLRGCIGTISPTRENLAGEIIYNALAAGLEDPRFPPVTVDELPELQYSVDVLSEPEPATVADLDPKVYGVIVSCGHRRGLLLPDLEGVDTVAEQVAIARQKGGIGPDEPYRLERFKVTRYH